MSLTTAMKRRVLNAIYGDTAVAPPLNLHVALSTTTPAADGTNFTRPVGNGYADVAVANNATNWPAASVANPSEKSNGTEIGFPNPTGPWGTVTHWGVAEAAGGTVIDWAPLDVARTIDIGSEPVRFLAGALKTRLRNPTV